MKGSTQTAAVQEFAFSPLQIAECDEDQIETHDGGGDSVIQISSAAAVAIENTLSSSQAVIAVVKCALGAGSFILPRTFAYSGVIFSCLGTITIGVTCSFTLYMLSTCELELRERYHIPNNRYLTYPDLGSLSFPNAQLAIGSRHINMIGCLILSGIIFTSIGVSAVYITFIHTVALEVLLSRGIDVSKEEILFVVFPIVLSLLWINDNRLLATLCAVGNISVFAGYAVVIIYGLQHTQMNGSLSEVMEVAPPRAVSSFFSSISFLFAIHVVMLPIVQKMKVKRDAPKVISISYTIITFVNIFFAVLAVVLYFHDNSGKGPCDNILLNVSNGTTLAAIKGFICVDLLFTIPMVMSAAREILEENVMTHFNISLENSKRHKFRFLFRTLLGTTSLIFSLHSSNISPIINMVGGLVCSLAGYIFPPAIYLKVMWSNLEWLQRIACFLIICFGFILIFNLAVAIAIGTTT